MIKINDNAWLLKVKHGIKRKATRRKEKTYNGDTYYKYIRKGDMVYRYTPKNASQEQRLKHYREQLLQIGIDCSRMSDKELLNKLLEVEKILINK